MLCSPEVILSRYDIENPVSLKGWTPAMKAVLRHIGKEITKSLRLKTVFELLRSSWVNTENFLKLPFYDTFFKIFVKFQSRVRI